MAAASPDFLIGTRFDQATRRWLRPDELGVCFECLELGVIAIRWRYPGDLVLAGEYSEQLDLEPRLHCRPCAERRGLAPAAVQS